MGLIKRRVGPTNTSVMASRNHKFIGLLLICFFLILSRVVFARDYDQKASRAMSHYLMAGVYETQEEFDKAVSEYKRALSLDYTNAIVHLRLGSVYIKMKEFDSAIKELNLAIKYDPDILESYFLLTLIYSMQNKHDLAVKEYEKFLTNATRLDPKNIELYNKLGQIYFEQDNLEAAEKIYRNIIKLSPKNTKARHFLGTIYEKQGRFKEAIEEFKILVDLNADNHLALNALGYLYAVEGINLDQAEVMIKKALEFEPNNAAYIDSLGWIYFKKGMIDLAVRELERAVSISEDPVILEHLGDSYFASGELEKAQTNWNKALELDPSRIDIKKKIEKLMFN